MIFKPKKSFLPIDGNLIGTLRVGWIGPGSNGNEEVLHTPQISRSLIFIIIPRTPFFVGGGSVLPSSRDACGVTIIVLENGQSNPS